MQPRLPQPPRGLSKCELEKKSSASETKPFLRESGHLLIIGD